MLALTKASIPICTSLMSSVNRSFLINASVELSSQDLLVEARENAVCENIFGLRANMVSQTKEIQSMNDNEFLRSLDILEAHVISLRDST